MPPESNRWMASGNTATCRAQGFILQVNIAGMIYNFMISLHFLLYIRYSFTDERARKFAEPAMHMSAIFFSVVTSLVVLGLDMLHESSLWCWINATPSGCKQTYQYGYTTCDRGDNAEIFRWTFFYAPLWTAAIGSMIIMFMIYRHVRHMENLASKWDFRREVTEVRKTAESPESQLEGDDQSAGASYYSIASSVSKYSKLSASLVKSGLSTAWWRKKKRRYKELEKEYKKSKIVAWQAYRYVGVFFVTWSAGSINRFLQAVLGHSFFWIMLLHSVLTPMQGMFTHQIVIIV